MTVEKPNGDLVARLEAWSGVEAVPPAALLREAAQVIRDYRREVSGRARNPGHD